MQDPTTFLTGAFNIVWLVTLAYLIIRPERWWNTQKARQCARVVAILVSIPGFMLLENLVRAFLIAVSRLPFSYRMPVAAAVAIMPGALYFILSGLIFKMKKIALPYAVIFVILRDFVRYRNWPLSSFVSSWGTITLFIAGQLALIEYLRRMRRWKYFQ